ncbi:MAG: YwaF family protein [Erysipelotrichaceae bacterium]|nr:YwaF family protein [Erysipelotrichaceae bacterium]
MFTWRHFVWLFICLVMIVLAVMGYDRKKPSLDKVLNTAVAICIFSEVSKVISTVRLVPSANGELLLPYLPLNHLPLHFCSIQILFICYVRYIAKGKAREDMLAFMYPTCVIGAILALAMPSIFTTSIPVEKAFVSLISYQFFIFHSMLIALGIIIAKSKEVDWSMRHLYRTIGGILLLGFVSIYLNSMFASPTYVDGQLVSVDFWTNFFFTYQNPIGIKITALWQWYAYILIVIALVFILVTAFMYPLIRKNRRQQ